MPLISSPKKQRFLRKSLQTLDCFHSLPEEGKNNQDKQGRKKRWWERAEDADLVSITSVPHWLEVTILRGVHQEVPSRHKIEKRVC